MNSLEDLWIHCKDKNNLYVKWNKQIWIVRSKSAFGFVIEDPFKLKAYIMHAPKQKLFEQMTSDDFENMKIKGK